MRPLGFFTIVTLVESVLAIGLLVASLPTRGWLSGELFLISTGMTLDVDIGLFYTSVGDSVFKTGDVMLLKNVLDYGSVHTTMILLFVGLGLLLLGAVGLLITVFKSPTVPSVVAHMVCHLISGILIITAVILIVVANDSEYLGRDFSWWFGMIAAVVALSSIGSLGNALRKGELERTALNVQRIF